ncbi:hypothetical protein Pfo_006257 [Paulownia fortunei]|nr:hypothetical protein Pfo_006257 [Paulownia fortunei]
MPRAPKLQKSVAAAAMAQNQNSSNSKGLFKKIYNATIRRVSRRPYQPQGSVPTVPHPNPQVRTTKTPAKTSPPLTKPAHIVQQASLSKTIPVEFGHPAAPVSAHKNKNVTIFSSNMRSDGALPLGHVENGAPKEAKPSVHVSAAKTKSLKDDVPMHQKRDEGKKMELSNSNDKFSDYITKVKDKMRTASNVGAAKSATRRDSFNDKISNYINRAKIKIRTTTNVGDDNGVSFK